MQESHDGDDARGVEEILNMDALTLQEASESRQDEILSALYNHGARLARESERLGAQEAFFRGGDSDDDAGSGGEGGADDDPARERSDLAFGSDAAFMNSDAWWFGEGAGGGGGGGAAFNPYAHALGGDEEESILTTWRRIAEEKTHAVEMVERAENEAVGRPGMPVPMGHHKDVNVCSRTGLVPPDESHNTSCLDTRAQSYCLGSAGAMKLILEGQTNTGDVFSDLSDVDSTGHFLMMAEKLWLRSTLIPCRERPAQDAAERACRVLRESPGTFAGWWNAMQSSHVAPDQYVPTRELPLPLEDGSWTGGMCIPYEMLWGRTCDPRYAHLRVLIDFLCELPSLALELARKIHDDAVSAATPSRRRRGRRRADEEEGEAVDDAEARAEALAAIPPIPEHRPQLFVENVLASNALSKLRRSRDPGKRSTIGKYAAVSAFLRLVVHIPAGYPSVTDLTTYKFERDLLTVESEAKRSRQAAASAAPEPEGARSIRDMRGREMGSEASGLMTTAAPLYRAALRFLPEQASHATRVGGAEGLLRTDSPYNPTNLFSLATMRTMQSTSRVRGKSTQSHGRTFTQTHLHFLGGTICMPRPSSLREDSDASQPSGAREDFALPLGVPLVYNATHLRGMDIRAKMLPGVQALDFASDLKTSHDHFGHGGLCSTGQAREVSRGVMFLRAMRDGLLLISDMRGDVALGIEESLPRRRAGAGGDAAGGMASEPMALVDSDSEDSDSDDDGDDRAPSRRAVQRLGSAAVERLAREKFSEMDEAVGIRYTEGPRAGQFVRGETLPRLEEVGEGERRWARLCEVFSVRDKMPGMRPVDVTRLSADEMRWVVRASAHARVYGNHDARAEPERHPLALEQDLVTALYSLVFVPTSPMGAVVQKAIRRAKTNGAGEWIQRPDGTMCADDMHLLALRTSNRLAAMDAERDAEESDLREEFADDLPRLNDELERVRSVFLERRRVFCEGEAEDLEAAFKEGRYTLSAPLQDLLDLAEKEGLWTDRVPAFRLRPTTAEPISPLGHYIGQLISELREVHDVYTNPWLGFMMSVVMFDRWRLWTNGVPDLNLHAGLVVSGPQTAGKSWLAELMEKMFPDKYNKVTRQTAAAHSAGGSENGLGIYMDDITRALLGENPTGKDDEAQAQRKEFETSQRMYLWTLIMGESTSNNPSGRRKIRLRITKIHASLLLSNNQVAFTPMTSRFAVVHLGALPNVLSMAAAANFSHGREDVAHTNAILKSRRLFRFVCIMARMLINIGVVRGTTMQSAEDFWTHMCKVLHDEGHALGLNVRRARERFRIYVRVLTLWEAVLKLRTMPSSPQGCRAAHPGNPLSPPEPRQRYGELHLRDLLAIDSMLVPSIQVLHTAWELVSLEFVPPETERVLHALRGVYDRESSLAKYGARYRTVVSMQKRTRGGGGGDGGGRVPPGKRARSAHPAYVEHSAAASAASVGLDGADESLERGEIVHKMLSAHKTLGRDDGYGGGGGGGYGPTYSEHSQDSMQPMKFDNTEYFSSDGSTTETVNMNYIRFPWSPAKLARLVHRAMENDEDEATMIEGTIERTILRLCRMNIKSRPYAHSALATSVPEMSVDRSAGAQTALGSASTLTKGALLAVRFPARTRNNITSFTGGYYCEGDEGHDQGDGFSRQGYTELHTSLLDIREGLVCNYDHVVQEVTRKFATRYSVRQKLVSLVFSGKMMGTVTTFWYDPTERVQISVKISSRAAPVDRPPPGESRAAPEYAVPRRRHARAPAFTMKTDHETNAYLLRARDLMAISPHDIAAYLSSTGPRDRDIGILSEHPFMRNAHSMRWIESNVDCIREQLKDNPDALAVFNEGDLYLHMAMAEEELIQYLRNVDTDRAASGRIAERAQSYASFIMHGIGAHAPIAPHYVSLSGDDDREDGDSPTHTWRGVGAGAAAAAAAAAATLVESDASTFDDPYRAAGGVPTLSAPEHDPESFTGVRRMFAPPPLIPVDRRRRGVAPPAFDVAARKGVSSPQYGLSRDSPDKGSDSRSWGSAY